MHNLENDPIDIFLGSTLENELPSEKSHPVTDPLGENSTNPAKKQENVFKPNQIRE